MPFAPAFVSHPKRATRCAARLVLLVAVLAGCAASTLRDAQRAFNEGARLEAEARGFEGAPPPIEPTRPASAAAAFRGVVAQPAARGAYERALAALEELDSDEEAELRRDGLWANVLALQALSLWRLARWDEAVAAARLASEEAEAGSRDAALMKALPGLVKNDQAHHRIRAGSADEASVRELLAGPRHGALGDIQRARQLQAGPGVQLYLIQAELSVLKNLKDLDSRETFSRIGQVTALRAELCDLAGGTDEGRLAVERWMRAFGATPSCSANGGD